MSSPFPWGQHPLHSGAEAHPRFLSFSPAARGSPAPGAGTALQPHEPLASESRHCPKAHPSCNRGRADPTHGPGPTDPGAEIKMFQGCAVCVMPLPPSRRSAVEWERGCTNLQLLGRDGVAAAPHAASPSQAPTPRWPTLGLITWQHTGLFRLAGSEPGGLLQRTGGLWHGGVPGSTALMVWGQNAVGKVGIEWEMACGSGWVRKLS